MPSRRRRAWAAAITLVGLSSHTEKPTFQPSTSRARASAWSYWLDLSRLRACLSLSSAAFLEWPPSVIVAGPALALAFSIALATFSGESSKRLHLTLNARASATLAVASSNLFCRMASTALARAQRARCLASTLPDRPCRVIIWGWSVPAGWAVRGDEVTVAPLDGVVPRPQVLGVNASGEDGSGPVAVVGVARK